jgi:hypothetical protein
MATGSTAVVGSVMTCGIVARIEPSASLKEATNDSAGPGLIG